jgi:uncharacterized OsmC-like protein
MEMKGQSERHFAVRLTHLDHYRFQSQASEGDNLHGEPYISDEPDPVGQASGPATPALLASAIGHCLSASLFEALRHAHVDVQNFETDAVAVVKPEDGFPRIERVDVVIRPRIPQTSSRTQRCEDIFEKYCTVSSSVKRGIVVNVSVDWETTSDMFEPT